MKFKKATYHVQIADMLRDMIMTGKLKEGDKVNEGKLCETMGISKTPMREALRVLSVEGLIRLIPNRGAFVTKPEFEEIVELFDVIDDSFNQSVAEACFRLAFAARGRACAGHGNLSSKKQSGPAGRGDGMILGLDGFHLGIGPAHDLHRLHLFADIIPGDLYTMATQIDDGTAA